MKIFRLFSLLSLFSLGLRAQSAAPAALAISPALVDQLLTEAQSSNPALRAAAARVEAASAGASAVRTWEDPTFSFGVWSGSSRGFEASQEGDLVYGVDQKLPLFHRPELARRVAAADTVRDQLAAASAAEQVRHDLTVALHALALTDREADIAGQNVRWLDATVATVDHRYRVGRASQVDWLKVQTDRAIAANDLQTRLLEQEHGEVALNRILNRPLHEGWPEFAEPLVPPALYYTQPLVEAALASEPRLKVLQQESASAEATSALTRRQRLPDVSVGVEARQYSGDGGVREGMMTLSFTVPWLNARRYDEDWWRDRDRQRAKELDAQDYALAVREELHHVIVDLDTARRQALLYRDEVIPLAEQTLRSAATAWENNLGLFQDVLDSHRMLLADELSLAQAVNDQEAKLADLALLTGTRDLATLVVLAGAAPSENENHHPLTSSP